MSLKSLIERIKITFCCKSKCSLNEIAEHIEDVGDIVEDVGDLVAKTAEELKELKDEQTKK